MKKLKYLALTAALSLTMSCTSAFAAEMPASDGNDYGDIPENFTEFVPDISNGELFFTLPDSVIGVMFNGEFIELNDRPVNIDGRVKLPFRELLENIGATVDYDETTAKVSAERKGIKIEFFLNSDKIYINNNGAQSELQMDTSIDIINDRTFVPVRFMAEAFELSVGWDEFFNTVVITDVDEYINTINENCSNYMKLSEMQYALNENYLSNMKLSFSLNEEDSSISEKSERKADITSVSQKYKDRTEVQTTLDFSYLSKVPEDNVNLSNVQFNIILDKDKLYLSTNLASVLKEAIPNNSMIALAASMLTPDVWLTGTLDELFTELFGMDKAQAELISAMLTQSQSFNKLFASLYTAGANENSVMYALSAANQADTMKNMFGNDKFKLTENADGSYSFDYKFTNEDLADYMLSIMTSSGISDEQPDEEFYQMLDAMDINMTMSGTVSDKETNSVIEMSYSMDMDEVKLNIKLDAESNSEAGAADLSGRELPKMTMKLSSILKILESQFIDL